MASPPLPTLTTFVTAPSLVARGVAALTTPYVFSAECAPQLLIGDKSDNPGPMIIETFLYQNRNYDYTSCQPPGLTAAFHDSKLYPKYNVYRGAVCPFGWHGFQLGDRSTSRRTEPSTWSTALCCKSGDSLVSDIWTIYSSTFGGSACASISTRHDDGTTEVFTTFGYMSVNPTEYIYTDTDTTTSQGTAYTVIGTRTITKGRSDYVTTEMPFTAGRVFYPPMSIEWVEEDNKSLVPPWPTLTNNMLVPTWQSTDRRDLSSRYENRGTGPIYTPLPPPSIQTKIAYPIIGVLAGIVLLMVLVLLWRMWRMWRRKRHAESKKIEQKWKDELNGRVPEEELEMADLGTEPEVGRDGLGRSEVGSEANLTEVPNILPVEGDEEGGRRGRRGRRP